MRVCSLLLVFCLLFSAFALADATPAPAPMATRNPGDPVSGAAAPIETRDPVSESDAFIETRDPESGADAPAATRDPDDPLPEADAFDDGEKIEIPQTHEELLELIDGARHILLVGLDARPGEKTGRSDTMMILTLDAEHEVIKLTSLMRDLYVQIPGRGGNRLNAAYVFGGPELLLDTIEQNFGLRIDDYVAVDFSLLARVIDQMGGLDVEIVSDKQMRAINGVIKEDNVVLGLSVGDGLLTQTGTQTLTGKQAQAYARYRKYESDFTRTERQREVVSLCIDKLAGMSMGEIMKLIADNIDLVASDLTVGDMVALLPAALALREAEVRQLRLPRDGEYENKTISGMAILLPNLDKARAALTQFINE